MPRVKRGRVRAQKRKRLLAQVKGSKWGTKKKVKLAKEAVRRAGAFAHRDRRAKKRTARALWNLRINAGSRLQGVSYSKLIGSFKKQNIQVDRKILSNLAKDHPKIFEQLVNRAKS